MAPQQADGFSTEVRERFGVLPNFFCTAASAPELIEKLWGFAKSGYLDNPLPSLFKERLFVHLSRFCEIRYCIVRHVGFLIGEGRPSGDAAAAPHTVEQAIALLNRPLPTAEGLVEALARLENQQVSVAMPDPGTQMEGDLFDALTIMFIAPRRAERARRSVLAAVGERAFEFLTAFMAFVRTAHYWTEMHPTLAFEADMVAVMERHSDLARLMLDLGDVEWAHSDERLRRLLADLQRAAGELRSSEDRFQAFVTATSDIVYRMSPDWSERRQLDGRGVMIDTDGPNRDWLNEYVHPDDHVRVTAAIADAVRTKNVFELEHRVKRLDGTMGWTLSRAVPLLDDSGEITEWLGAARDVSARRGAEEALRDSDRRKDEFLATLAHELRNPLAPLRTGLQIARLDTGPDSPLRRTLEVMDRQLNHLVHLVDDLLDIGRINTGKIELRRQRVKLSEVLIVSADASRPAIDQHGHSFVVEPDGEELYVDGDFDRLTQVFSNLLSNAAKYTDSGGTIELRVAREGGDAVVSISDTGIGIAPADLQSVFELFSQVRSRQGRPEGGLGIGLSLVRQLVEMHQGSVSATSAGPGRGSTFTVRLPLTRDIGASVVHEPAQLSQRPVARHSVLVVDDNEDAAASLAMLLERLGHDVHTAYDGRSCMAKAEAMHPDLVFLDLGMPGMSGFDVAKKLRALPHGGGITLVALTGWGRENDQQRTRDAGFDRHLLKPIDLAELAKLLAVPALPNATMQAAQ